MERGFYSPLSSLKGLKYVSITCNRSRNSYLYHLDPKTAIMAIVAIDWDNVIMNGKEWLSGAKEAIGQLRELNHRVIIHSCNDPKWIEKNLREAGIPVDLIWNQVGKPNCDIFIDDKGYYFPYNGNWNEELPKILTRLEGLGNRKW